MVINFEVADDFVRVDEGRKKVERPLHVSRSRWRAFWVRFSQVGLSEKSLLEFKQMMERKDHDHMV